MSIEEGVLWVRSSWFLVLRSPGLGAMLGGVLAPLFHQMSIEGGVHRQGRIENGKWKIEDAAAPRPNEHRGRVFSRAGGLIVRVEKGDFHGAAMR